MGKKEGSQKRSVTGLYIKTILITCLGLLLSFTNVHANSNNKLETVYHVYIDDEHIGKVDDEAVVQKLVNKKLTSEKQNYEDLDLVIAQSVAIIPEKVFNPSFNNDKVTNKLNDVLTVEANSYAIVVDKEVVGYFADEEVAEKVLKTYQLTYVDEEDLEKLEKENKEAQAEKQNQSTKEIDNKKQIDELPEVGSSLIRDVTFSKDVVIVEKNSLPEDVITLDQGVKLLSKGTLEEKKHKIVAGDVLEKIALQYDLETEELLELNPGITEDSILQIDQELNVTFFEPYMQVVVAEEEVIEKVASFETEIIETDQMYKGDEKIEQTGKDGMKEVHYKLEKINGKETKREVLNEKITEEPVKEIIIKGTKVIPSRGSGNLSWPADGGYVSSKMGTRWGRMHKGIDIARPASRTITAADHGVIEFVGRDGSYGNKIVINHNNGMKTIYAHLSSMDVRVGQTVEKGMKIGIMGSTGNSTGIHLHFEVHQNGSLKNPLDYF